MRVTLCGAAGGEVTGSGYLLETDRATILVDFGMFQGAGATDERNRAIAPVDPAALDAVVLTHAHLDHTGRLPLLARHGLDAPIWGTPATLDFTGLILDDAARIQESDARRLNRERARAGLEPVEPFYTSDDVAAVRSRLTRIDYENPREVAPGITARLVDAGHILGSASVELTVEDAGATRTIVFSGDVGRWDAPILRDPTPLERADLVFLESTYGDRGHRSFEATADQFCDALKEAVWAKQKILIPAFAIGRTQLLLFYIAELFRENRLPTVPVFLDSPMAIKATELYRRHQDLFDEEAKDLARRRRFRIDLRSLKFAEKAADSRELNDFHEACIIIAGSGMCDGGRIVHHLKHNLWRPHVTVLSVGYMAAGSLGRELVEGARSVEIFERPVAVRASIETLGGFSAHAGQDELLRWFEPLAASSPKVCLTHGEDRQRRALAEALGQAHGIEAQLPGIGETVEL
jgi:metallo-beta-lactamase family protein